MQASMRRTLANLILAGTMLSACNPAAGDGTLADNRAEVAAGNAAAPPGRDLPLAAPAPQDPLVPETAFHAAATLRCVTRVGRAPRDCSSGAIRNADGSATVTVFWPEGRSRAIFFDAAHRAIGADTAEADGSAGQPFAARRSGSQTIVTIGPERYEIPDSLVRGN